MFGALIVYGGLIVTAAGLVLVLKPSPWLRVPTRRRALVVGGGGLLLTVIGLMLPAAESHAAHSATRLDEFAPAWQFHEIHTIAVAAPPTRVFEDIRRVRADEIFLFRTLIWIRRGGRPATQDTRKAGAHCESLIDVALRTSFVRLAEDVPRELVVGTVVGAPPDWHGPLTAADFQRPLPPGFVLAAMNFVVTADNLGGSVITTETRVFANSPSARRQFAAYWRIIYPGSALIRRMWLRAIRRRATSPDEPRQQTLLN